MIYNVHVHVQRYGSLIGGLVAINSILPKKLGISSSQLANSYFSEGWLNHRRSTVEEPGRTAGARSARGPRLRILLFARREAWPRQVPDAGCLVDGLDLSTENHEFFRMTNGKLQQRRW